MVTVKGGASSIYTTVTQLGLSPEPIPVIPEVYHENLTVDAWGGPEAAADVQVFLGAVSLTFNLVHVDPAVLEEWVRLSFGGPTAAGMVARAGTRLGGAVGGAAVERFAAGWKYMELGIASPQAGRPYRFYAAYLTGQPRSEDLGVRRSTFSLNVKCIPYTTDPWQGGSGAANQIIWDRIAQS